MVSEPSRPGRAATRRAGRSHSLATDSGRLDGQDDMARMKDVEFGPEITRRQDSTLTARLRRRCRVTKRPAQFTIRSVESCETRPRQPANSFALAQSLPARV